MAGPGFASGLKCTTHEYTLNRPWRIVDNVLRQYWRINTQAIELGGRQEQLIPAQLVDIGVTNDEAIGSCSANAGSPFL